MGRLKTRQKLWQSVILRQAIDQNANLHELAAGTASGTAPLSRYSERVNFPWPQDSFREGSRLRRGSILVSVPGLRTTQTSSGFNWSMRIGEWVVSMICFFSEASRKASTRFRRAQGWTLFSGSSMTTKGVRGSNAATRRAIVWIVPAEISSEVHLRLTPCSFRKSVKERL